MLIAKKVTDQCDGSVRPSARAYGCAGFRGVVDGESFREGKGVADMQLAFGHASRPWEKYS